MQLLSFFYIIFALTLWLESTMSVCVVVQTRREPQWGPGKHSGGPPNIFAGPFRGENL